MRSLGNKRRSDTRTGHEQVRARRKHGRHGPAHAVEAARDCIFCVQLACRLGSGLRIAFCMCRSCDLSVVLAGHDSPQPSRSLIAACGVRCGRYESLPRLAVVMTTTKDYVNPDRLARVHNVESWAIRHGYLFYNNVIETQDYRSVGRA